MYCFLIFFFMLKTAYEMRISDWSSDVCSSDLIARPRAFGRADAERHLHVVGIAARAHGLLGRLLAQALGDAHGDFERGIRHHDRELLAAISSEERRVGNECGSTCSSRWCADK